MAPRAGAVIHVATNGADTATCGSASAPCASIPFGYARAASGDTIDVGAGTFTLANALTIQKAGLRLLGAKAGVNAANRTPGGPGETVVTGPVPQLSPTGLFDAAADNVTIDGFTFANNGNGSGLSTSENFSGYVIEDNILFNNVTGLDPGSNGTIRTLIEGNLFDRNNNPNSSGSGNGIFTLRPLSNVLLQGNTYRGNDQAPINLAEGGMCGSGRVSNIKIQDNDFTGEFRVALTGVSNSSVANNTMVTGNGGVNMTGCDHGITVTGNNITDKTIQGVRICNCLDQGNNTHITVTDNTIHDVGKGNNDGITISGSSEITIRGNDIINAGRDGIGFIADLGPHVPNTGVTITQNTIVGARGPDSGIDVGAGTYTGVLLVRFNRIVDSVSGHGLVDDDPAAMVDARENWWGCNSMPAGTGCGHPAGTAVGNIEFTPWLVLRINSVPADILAGQAATIFADLQHDSAGALTSGPFFAPVTADFTATLGHVSPVSVLTTAALHARTNWPSGQPRPEQLCVRVDNQTVCLRFAVLPEVSLPVTGPDLLPRAGAGIALVWAGGVILLARRRRKSRAAARFSSRASGGPS